MPLGELPVRVEKIVSTASDVQPQAQAVVKPTVKPSEPLMDIVAYFQLPAPQHDRTKLEDIYNWAVAEAGSTQKDYLWDVIRDLEQTLETKESAKDRFLTVWRWVDLRNQEETAKEGREEMKSTAVKREQELREHETFAKETGNWMPYLKTVGKKNVEVSGNTG